MLWRRLHATSTFQVRVCEVSSKHFPASIFVLIDNKDWNNQICQIYQYSAPSRPNFGFDQQQLLFRDTGWVPC
jgi:hypothetical protein